MTVMRRILISAALAPLALGLAACGKEGGESSAPSGAPLATVAAPAGKAWGEVIAITPEGGYRMGNPEAPIKVVEYGSLTCPHCAEFAEAASAELRDKYVASGRVSYEFRNFVRDALDITATQLTQCGTPESFFALTDQVFGFQKQMYDNIAKAPQQAQQAALGAPPAQRGPAVAQLTGLTDFFAARGIAKDQANACLADVTKAEKLAKQTTEQGQQFEIQGTPTFIVNGKKVDYNTWPLLKAELERLGAR